MHTLTDTERYILETLRELRYGTVAITVHDARVVQVEVSRKVRFDAAAPGQRPDQRPGLARPE